MNYGKNVWDDPTCAELLSLLGISSDFAEQEGRDVRVNQLITCLFLQRTQAERVAVIFAHCLAGNYDGPGSGFRNAELWLRNEFGEDFNPRILELYEPPKSRVPVYSRCAACPVHYNIGSVAEGDPPLKGAPPTALCPECAMKDAYPEGA